MRKMLFGALLSAAMFCFGSFGVGIFSAAYADDRAVSSEQVTLPVFVADNFDTVCTADASVVAKREDDDKRMSIDVITQSERNLRHDSVWLLGLNNQYLQNQYLRQ